MISLDVGGIADIFVQGWDTWWVCIYDNAAPQVIIISVCVFLYFWQMCSKPLWYSCRSFSADVVVLGQNNPRINSDSIVNEFAIGQQPVSVTFFVRNTGPSVINNAMLTIRWPLTADENRYYLYPYAAVTGVSVN